MRRHGWGGHLPADDAEARQRIVDAAREIVATTAAAPTMAEVALLLSVSRATVYRYYPSAEALLAASAADGIDSFLTDITRRVEAMTDAADVVVEGIAFTFEEIERRTELMLVLAPPAQTGAREITSALAGAMGRSILESTRVDWAAMGYDTRDELDALATFMLRILQSLILDPGDPPLHGDPLRAYLRRWVGPAASARATAPHDDIGDRRRRPARTGGRTS